MQLNRQKVAGNLAQTATIRKASDTRDVLEVNVIANRRIGKGENAKEVSTGFKVVRFGKTGQFDSFVEKYLQAGMPVFAEGVTEKSIREKDGEKFLNVQVNASFNGTIAPIQASANLNEQEIAGYLAEDAVVRSTAKGEVLSFTVLTTESWFDGNEQKSKTTSHNVVQYGEKGKFTKLAEMLKTGAGVYLTGNTEKELREHNGKKFLNVTVNATFKNITITRYATEKEEVNTAPQEPQQPQQQVGMAQQPQQPAYDPDEDIPF